MKTAIFRRQILRTKEARKLGLFNFPHTFNKDNPAFLNLPQEDRYASIPREYKAGDIPQLAYQNVRKFPDWYKPYLHNYYGHGYIILYFLMMGLYTWTYKKEIMMVKGRKRIIDYDHEDCQTFAEKTKKGYALDRIAAGDPQWTRYLHDKRRNESHH